MIFLCYPQCSTCQKAQKWLDANGEHYKLRNIKDDKPTEAELRAWHGLSCLPLKKFFNTSGLLYKEQGLKDKLPGMTEDEICPARNGRNARQAPDAHRRRLRPCRLQTAGMGKNSEVMIK